MTEPLTWDGDPASLFDLTGKAALVTGGSRGLGREMALAFARFGADVMIASRKQDSCDGTAAEITRLTGRSAVPRACHVGQPSAESVSNTNRRNDSPNSNGWPPALQRASCRANSTTSSPSCHQKVGHQDCEAC